MMDLLVGIQAAGRPLIPGLSKARRHGPGRAVVLCGLRAHVGVAASGGEFSPLSPIGLPLSWAP